jgi:hypothetical protein
MSEESIIVENIAIVEDTLLEPFVAALHDEFFGGEKKDVTKTAVELKKWLGTVGKNEKLRTHFESTLVLGDLKAVLKNTYYALSRALLEKRFSGRIPVHSIAIPSFGSFLQTFFVSSAQVLRKQISQVFTDLKTPDGLGNVVNLLYDSEVISAIMRSSIQWEHVIIKDTQGKVAKVKAATSPKKGKEAPASKAKVTTSVVVKENKKKVKIVESSGEGNDEEEEEEEEYEYEYEYETTDDDAEEEEEEEEEEIDDHEEIVEKLTAKLKKLPKDDPKRKEIKDQLRQILGSKY